jgi:hypothetical protein
MRFRVCAVLQPKFERLMSAHIRKGTRLGYILAVCEINRLKTRDSH